MPEGGITAFPGYDVFDLTYKWSNSRTTKDIAGLAAGNYSVRISDKLLCTDADTFTLTQPARLTAYIELVNPLSCKGADAVLAPVITGGIPDYRSIWNPPIDYHLDYPVTLDTLYDVIEGRYLLQIIDTNNCAYSTSFDLSQPDAAYIWALPEKFGNYEIRCHGESNGTWTSFNNNLGMIEYHWTGPYGFDTTFTNSSLLNVQTNVPAGKYTLNYTDVAGCHGKWVLDMLQPDSLKINRATLSRKNSLYNVSCFGSDDGSITLNEITGGHASRGYNYAWTSSGGGAIADTTVRNLTGITAGTYWVTVTDAFNCSVSGTYDLIQPDEILLNADLSLSTDGDYNLNCYGDTLGSITLDPSGGDISTGTYRYNWQVGGTSNELTNLSAGNYVVTVTDGINCSVTDTLEITQPALITIDSTRLSSYYGYEVSCPTNTDGSIRLYISGGSGSYSYEWDMGGVPLLQDTSYLSGLGTGEYNLLLTDENNCKLTRSETLQAPPDITLILETSNLNCTGTEPGSASVQVSGGILPYVYAWDNGSETSSISGLDTGIYVITVTDHNLCQKSDTAVIAQNNPPMVEIQLTDSISCSGNSDGVLYALVTQGIAPYSYLWNDNSNAEYMSSAGEGNYSVTVTDQDGCSNSDSIIVTDPEPLEVSFLVTPVQCFGLSNGSVSLDAVGGTPGYSYFWENMPVTGSEVVNLPAGVFDLRVTDRRNCTTDTTIMVDQPGKLIISLVEANMVYPFCPDWANGAVAIRVAGGTRNYQYDWTDYPQDIDSILNDVREDSYTITVTDARGCSADSSFRLLSQNNTCLGIPTAFTPNYDNANDTWDISYINESGGESPFHEVYPNGTIQVYDRLGNLVYRCAEGCQEEWNGEDLKGRKLAVDSYYYIIDLNNSNNTPTLKGIVTIIR
jgi:gliding motility-associated-like protein